MIRFFNIFTKITAFPVQFLCFRTKTYYEDKSVQSKKISGSAIIISNHTSLYDYAVFLFVFFFRTLRYQMAEVLFRKKFLGVFLRALGGIYVDRDSRDFSFISKSEEILSRGGVVGVFPEARLPKKDEARPLEFKPSAAYLAYITDTKIIPVYTDGSYFSKQRARVIIGTPIRVADIIDKTKTDKENIELINSAMREKIIRLGELLNEKREQRKK